MDDAKSDKEGETRKRKQLEDEERLALMLSYPPEPPSPRLRSIRALLVSQNPQQQQQPQPQLNFSHSPSLHRRPVVSDFLMMTSDIPTPVNGGGEVVSSRRYHARHNPNQAPGRGKSETVPAPFPWATSRRATVYSLESLLSKRIFSISGEVQCRRCDRRFVIEYDLRQKFAEIATYIAENKNSMHDRAPSTWKTPVLPGCSSCKQVNVARPIVAEKKKSINWLFLLLGQMLGCCTLDQLKYFCKHTKNHRTGAKDRVLYLTYLGLCKQLDPNGPFDR